MPRARAFSVVELIVVILILGAVAVIAWPRLSQATPAPDDAATLRAQLKILRVAIERYHQDHGVYPGRPGNDPRMEPSEDIFVAQLTQHTDDNGHVAPQRDAAHHFGPYLRDGIPACPVPPGHGLTGVLMRAQPTAGEQSQADTGWVYDASTGRIFANTNARDSDGQSYGSY